jgi:LacI family transcriptional regulator
VKIPGRPTLADVAARAGVSLKTASRALNGEYGVARTTAERVLRSSKELGFRPNHLARSLASRRPSAAVGLVVSSVADPFFAALAGAVEEVLAPRDLQLVIASHGDDENRQRRIIRTLIERRVDALLLVPAPGDCGHLRREVDLGLVVTGLDRPPTGLEVDTVTVDNRTGAFDATRRFLRAGHRRIAFLANDSRLWTIQQRHAGYLSALRESGVACDPTLIHQNCSDAAASERIVARMLRLPHPPTALFAAQHLIGRGAIRALLGVRDPLAMASMDEIADTDLLVLRPFVVESGPVRMGRAAASMALERLDGLTGEARSVVLPPLFRNVEDDLRGGRGPGMPAKSRMPVTSPLTQSERS